jgi:hypothetical protein
MNRDRRAEEREAALGVASTDGSLAPLDATEPYDVCIVGSGPAGTVLGGALVGRGARVLILESGRDLQAWFTDRRIRSLARYDFSGDTDYPLSRTTSRVLGGNSNFWTGRCERFHPSDFERHAYTPPENPWPITYADLDSYYDEAERLLRVRGGPRSEFAPPRRAPPPLPPNPDISYLKGLGTRLGVTFEESLTATPTKTIRIFKVQREILPGFLDSGLATLVTGATVTRLLAGPDGCIAGAEVKAFDGTTKVARARYFVVSCGGIESPRVLLLSTSEQFPNGVGNRHDMVGRGFNEHPNVSFTGTLPHSWGTIVPTNKIARTHQFYSTFRGEGLGSIFPVIRQAWVLPNHIAEFRLANLPRTFASGLGRVFRAPLFVDDDLAGQSGDPVPIPDRHVWQPDRAPDHELLGRGSATARSRPRAVAWLALRAQGRERARAGGRLVPPSSGSLSHGPEPGHERRRRRSPGPRDTQSVCLRVGGVRDRRGHAALAHDRRPGAPAGRSPGPPPSGGVIAARSAREGGASRGAPRTGACRTRTAGCRPRT